MKVTFTESSLIRGMSGRMGNLIFRQRNGTTYAYTRSAHQRPTTTSPQVRQTRNDFRTASSMTTEIMASPTLRSMYAARFAKQKHYKSLRGYIFAAMFKQLKGGLS